MGPVGGGGWRVGPHVLDPAGANGSKPVDATSTRPSADKFEKPKPSATKGPKPPTGLQGNRMAGFFGGLKNWAGKGFAAFNVLDAANSARQGKWNEAAGSLATWGLTSAVSNPWLAPFALDLIDTQHAGPRGPLPELTAEQKTLQEQIRKKGEESGSFRYTDGSTTKELESIHHHPDLPGPAGNKVGSDLDPSAPGLQGSGSVPEMAGMSTADQQMFQWARNFEGLAKKVKPGQAGYAVIQQALGKAPSKIEDVDFSSKDAAAFGMSKPEQDIRQSGGFTEWTTDMDADASAKVEKSAQDFLKERINSGFYSASSKQQPNFDGSNDTIGEDSKPIPLEVQDFDNATKNPAEVVPTTYHPLNKPPTAEQERENAEYAAMEFQFDPSKNMMIRIK